MCVAPVFFCEACFFQGLPCRADHLREVGRLSGGLPICLLYVWAPFLFAQLEFFRVRHGPAWLWSLADVWGKTQEKRIFMYIGGGCGRIVVAA